MTGVLWTAESAAAATGGTAAAAWQATGVSIDSRTLAPGELFIAIQGPNFDGHDFVEAALAAGAAAAMVSRRPERLGAEAPLLMVAHIQAGLEALAAAARARTQAWVSAITGSVGKTSTKEALGQVLSAQGATHMTRGNLNNHWGLPLTLAGLPGECRFAVLEMGMSHPGEIAPLSRLARPHIAVVTNVETAHRAHFDSDQGIADAKAEIFAGLQAGGTAVLNRDNRWFDRLSGAAEAAGAKVLSFGFGAAADVRALAVLAEPRGQRVSADFMGRRMSFTLGQQGRHWVANGLCVLAAAHALGADVAWAAETLAKVTPLAGRGQRHEIVLAGGSAVIIDDSYNASPASMAAAFEVLAGIPAARRVAVLGDMLELGADSEALHAQLLAPLTDAGVDLVFTAGPGMAALWQALPREKRGAHAADSAALAPLLRAALRAGDVVTVKGSAGSRMRLVVDQMLAINEGQAGNQPRAVNGG